MARVAEANHDAITQAALLLKAGEIIAFPTETVYGLGADTLNPNALEKIYKLKGRPSNNPLIAHVLDEKQAQMLVANWDERCTYLVKHFWPGPLTIVLNKSDSVPTQATAGLDTIAVRSPAHEVARQLLKEFGGAISAPSANKSGRVSPTAAKHVLDDYPQDDLLVLDGGACEVGIESTVLDLSKNKASVLRLGAVTSDQICQVIGEIKIPHIAEQSYSPGTSLKHYSPETEVVLVQGKVLSQYLADQESPVVVLCFDAAAVCSPHQVIVMPDSEKQYAARLYDALREADSKGLSRIVIEKPNCADGNWAAICDRLMRASAK